jgi:type II secretory pathway component PulJ
MKIIIAIAIASLLLFQAFAGYQATDTVQNVVSTRNAALASVSE